ncbi:MAG: nitrilase-related carbon-nitrogen hydrolase, partial [Pseudomonadales bacterium]
MDTLRVALVQSELVWEDAQANTELFDRLLAPLTDVDLIVLPEMFNSGFSMTPQRFAESMDGQSIAWMRQTATRLGSAVCGSLAVREGEHFANRFVFAHPDGALDCYDKRHCFRMSGEHEIYRAGE